MTTQKLDPGRGPRRMSDPLVKRTFGAIHDANGSEIGTSFAIVIETVESDSSGQPATQEARYFVANRRVTREVYLDALATMTAVDIEIELR